MLPSAALTASAALAAGFFAAELSVAVLVEFAQRGLSVFQFVQRQIAVVVGVERAQQQIAAAALPALALAALSALALAALSALTLAALSALTLAATLSAFGASFAILRELCGRLRSQFSLASILRPAWGRSAVSIGARPTLSALAAFASVATTTAALAGFESFGFCFSGCVDKVEGDVAVVEDLIVDESIASVLRVFETVARF